MRELTATLLAAQREASSRPYVRAVISDHYGEIARLRYSRHYDGAEGDYYSAAVGTGDGSLIRAHIDPATKVLYTQRVTSPGPGSDFSSWTSHGTVSAQGAVALAASGSSVFLFYVAANTTSLQVKQSSDNGATYGSAATIATAASAVTYLAAAIAQSGDRVLFWTVGASVWSSRYTGGAWGTPAEWTNTVDAISGLACAYVLDWSVAVCGAEDASGDAKVWTAIYGDDVNQPADTWSGLAEVTTATAGSGVSFLAPAVIEFHHWRLFFVEKYEGGAAYARLQWSTMDTAAGFNESVWREPTAFDYEGDYGVAVAFIGSRIWLSSAAGVWSGETISPLDVTADVIEAAVELDEAGGRARLVLRNDSGGNGAAGRYAGHGSGALALLQRGACLQLDSGYHTTDGAEASAGPSFWIEVIEQTTGPEPRLTLLARDGWWLLERWRARRQFAWPAGTMTVFQLLRFVCARAGLRSGSISASDTLIELQPAFTIHPGESGRTAVLRLLAMVPDAALFQGSVFILRHPQPDDATDYEYGSGHAITSARYRDAGPDSNRARVIGNGVLVDAFDFAEIEAAGERSVQVIDLNLTTEAEASGRAAVALEDAAARSRRDEVGVFGVNCGQELYDVVEVTDQQAGLDAAPRRVLGLGWRYGGAGKRRYEMTLALGKV